MIDSLLPIILWNINGKSAKLIDKNLQVENQILRNLKHLTKTESVDHPVVYICINYGTKRLHVWIGQYPIL